MYQNCNSRNIFFVCFSWPQLSHCSLIAVMMMTSILLSINIHAGAEGRRPRLTDWPNSWLYSILQWAELFYFRTISLPFLFLVSFIKLNCFSSKRQRYCSISIHLSVLLISSTLFFCRQKIEARYGFRTGYFQH